MSEHQNQSDHITEVNIKIDVHIGKMIAKYRAEKGVSAEDLVLSLREGLLRKQFNARNLSDEIEVDYLAFERGEKTIPSGLLASICNRLNVKVDALFPSIESDNSEIKSIPATMEEQVRQEMLGAVCASLALMNRQGVIEVKTFIEGQLERYKNGEEPIGPFRDD